MPSKTERENSRKVLHFEYLQIVNSARRAAMKAVYEAVGLWIGGDPESLGVDAFQKGPLPGEACGGATVSVDARSRFGRWAIENVGWTRGYPGAPGWELTHSDLARTERRFTYRRSRNASMIQGSKHRGKATVPD
jgi:hypothetical protein